MRVRDALSGCQLVDAHPTATTPPATRPVAASAGNGAARRRRRASPRCRGRRRIARRVGIIGDLAARAASPRLMVAAIVPSTRSATSRARRRCRCRRSRRSSTPTARRWRSIGTVNRTIVRLDKVPEAGALGRPRRRGPQLLQRARRLDHRHAARGVERPHRRRHAGRLGHHAAVREERLSQQLAHAQPQAQGTGDRGEAVAASTRRTRSSSST